MIFTPLRHVRVPHRTIIEGLAKVARPALSNSWLATNDKAFLDGQPLLPSHYVTVGTVTLFGSLALSWPLLLIEGDYGEELLEWISNNPKITLARKKSIVVVNLVASYQILK